MRQTLQGRDRLNKARPGLKEWWPLLMMIAAAFLMAVGLLLVSTSPTVTQAAGTVSVCNTYGPGPGTLQQALIGGGAVSFSCDGNIVVSNTISISTTASLDATGHNVTLTSGGGVQIIAVSPGVSLTLRNLTLSGANNAGDGGAIYLDSGSLNVENSKFSGNTSGRGGAIFATNSTGTTSSVTISNTRFENNQAGSGAGLYSNSTSSASINVTVTNSYFTNSQATSGNGGAVFSSHTGNLAIIGSTFDNSAARSGQGGGVWSQVPNLSITGSTFQSNVASSGGGLADQGQATTISNTTFIYNSATNSGGGLSHSYGVLTIDASTFSSNNANSAAGILNVGGYTRANTLNLYNSTLVSNTAYYGVGGGLNSTTEAPPTQIPNATIQVNTNIANSTFSANRANQGSGGAIASTLISPTTSAVTTITNTTIYSNTASAGGNSLFNNSGGVGTSTISAVNTIVATSAAGANCSGLITNGGNNLQYTDQTCFSGLTPADPLLGPLANNGGPTLTHDLRYRSPAIDAGSNTVCGAAPVNNLDQRGVTRPQGTICDIGAVEKIGGGCDPSVVTSATDPTIAACGTLRNALSDLNANRTITISLTAGSVIPLTSGLVVPESVTVTVASGCGASGPTLTLNGSGVNGVGLTLSRNDYIIGVRVVGFNGNQIKAPAGGGNRLRCVVASRNP